MTRADWTRSELCFRDFSAALAAIDRNNPEPDKVYGSAMHIALYRSAAFSLALAAMLLRALVPNGWMPSDHIGGFTICSVERGHHSGKPTQGEERTHTPCAFAAASTLAPLTSASFVFGASTAAFRIAADISDREVVATATHRPNAARAPPVFA
jgi:hypothetical protein